MAGQRRVIGGVLKVPLGDGWHAYAWTLPEVDFALFDLRSDIDMPATEVVTHPFVFRVGVNGAAYLDGRWPRIGKVTPPPEVLAPVPTYIQDQFTGQFSIYLAGDIRPATRAECIGLECCAIWAPEQVEDRIRDHFAGRPCKWGKSLAAVEDIAQAERQYVDELARSECVEFIDKCLSVCCNAMAIPESHTGLEIPTLLKRVWTVVGGISFVDLEDFHTLHSGRMWQSWARTVTATEFILIHAQRTGLISP